MESPNNSNIEYIIYNLFSRMDLKEKENNIKDYIVSKLREKEEETKKKLKNEEVLFEKYKESLKDEAEDFINKFLNDKEFCLEASDESPFTLNDIKKYINFRESIPEINNNTIQLFIFSYNFSQKENIRKINDKLNLINIGFVPSID